LFGQHLSTIVDSIIYLSNNWGQINCYPMDKCLQSTLLNYSIHRIVIYLVDSIIHTLNNWNLTDKTVQVHLLRNHSVHLGINKNFPSFTPPKSYFICAPKISYNFD